jgi:hypothetical protein
MQDLFKGSVKVGDNIYIFEAKFRVEFSFTSELSSFVIATGIKDDVEIVSCMIHGKVSIGRFSGSHYHNAPFMRRTRGHEAKGADQRVNNQRSVFVGWEKGRNLEGWGPFSSLLYSRKSIHIYTFAKSCEPI